MPRKKITPEEETPKATAPEENAAAGTAEVTPHDRPPDSEIPADTISEPGPEMTVPEVPDEDTEGGIAPEGEMGDIPAEEIAASENAAEADTAPEESSPVEEDSAAALIGELPAAVESVLNAPADTPPEDASEDVDNAVNMTPGAIPELHETESDSEAYSVDLSEVSENSPSTEQAIPDDEESDWGFGEPKRETVAEEAPPVSPEPPASPEAPRASKTAGKSDRQLFYELKFNALDRGLTPEERQEWNSIYASYRGRSAITGRIIGVDPLSIYVWNPETERREKKTMYCAIVVPYRVRIVIPASEMWDEGGERPDYVLQNMVGANVDLVIIKVEREAGFAIGSRRIAGRSQRYFFAHREDLHRVGARVKCQLQAVGPRRCLVNCYGHDLDLTQREMRYAAIPDLRDEYHPGMELECVVKVYDPDKDELVISIKETEANPFFGAEQRHPVGSRRLAVISGKYGGGVFCNLTDGVVCMCNYSFQHEDSDFMVGENVMLVVQRYDDEKLQMFGKIMSKW